MFVTVPLNVLQIWPRTWILIIRQLLLTSIFTKINKVISGLQVRSPRFNCILTKHPIRIILSIIRKSVRPQDGLQVQRYGKKNRRKFDEILLIIADKCQLFCRSLFRLEKIAPFLAVELLIIKLESKPPLFLSRNLACAVPQQKLCCLCVKLAYQVKIPRSAKFCCQRHN